MKNQSMKNRKLMAASVAATFVVTAVAPAAGLAAANFSDVKEGDFYFDYVTALSDAKIIDGRPDGSFDLGGKINRAEASKMIAKILGLNTETAPAAKFSDVDQTKWYAEFVNALFAEKLINGKSADKFDPTGTLTRGEFAKMVVEAYDLTLNEKGPVANFSDVSGDIWYADYVKVLYSHELVNGTTATTFSPNAPIKRADFAKLLTETDWAKGETLAKPEAATPAVEDVKAINAKQLEITFNTAVDQTTVVNKDTKALKEISIIGAANGTTFSAEFKNEKTLVVTASTSLDDKDLIVDVPANKVKDKEGKFVEAVVKKLSVDDTVAPTIVGSKNLNASQVQINFSEPVQAATPTVTYVEDGSRVTGANIVFDASGEFATVTFDADVKAEKGINVQFVGLKDFAGNLVTPNPAKVTVQKGNKDGVAPTVSTLNVLSPNKFEIIFSEEVLGLTNTDFTGVTVDSIKLDETNSKRYVVTLSEAQDGLKTVGLAAGALSDFSGEVNAAFSKIVEFKADKVAPTLSSAVVSKDSADGKEYLTLTFNKDVVVSNAAITLTGTKRVSGVSSAASVVIPANKLVSVLDSNSVYKIALEDVTGLTSGAAYTLSLPAAVVENVSGVDNAAQTDAIKFTRGTDTNVSAQGVASVTVTGLNTIQVQFNHAFDVADAENEVNYVIDGAVVEKAENFDQNKKVITLTLEEGKTTFSGVRNIAISNIKTTDGITMTKAYKGTVELNENIAPTVLSAVLQASRDEVVVTFSEAVKDGATKGNDFDVFLGTSKTALTEAATAETLSADGKTLTIKLANELNTLEGGLNVKASSSIDMTDMNGTALSFTEKAVTTTN